MIRSQLRIVDQRMVSHETSRGPSSPLLSPLVDERMFVLWWTHRLGTKEDLLAHRIISNDEGHPLSPRELISPSQISYGEL